MGRSMENGAAWRLPARRSCSTWGGKPVALGPYSLVLGFPTTTR